MNTHLLQIALWTCWWRIVLTDVGGSSSLWEELFSLDCVRKPDNPESVSRLASSIPHVSYPRFYPSFSQWWTVTWNHNENKYILSWLVFDQNIFITATEIKIEHLYIRLIKYCCFPVSVSMVLSYFWFHQWFFFINRYIFRTLCP